MFNFRLILLLGLFLALLVKGGQLCSAEGVQAMTRLVELKKPEPVEPLPLRTTEEDFKGISPRPDLTEKAVPTKKVVKSLQSLHVRKPGNQPQAQAKAAGKDTAKEQRKAAKKG